jgi:hypothetical protein
MPAFVNRESPAAFRATFIERAGRFGATRAPHEAIPFA